MECNGFNSDNYRYFRNIVTGEIIKYSIEDLKDELFGTNFTRLLVTHIEPYQIKKYPEDIPFDMATYINMQDSMVFKHDCFIDFYFFKDEFLPITDWLKEKIGSQLIPRNTFFMSSGPQSIRERNKENLQEVDAYELIMVNNIGPETSLL